LGEQLRNLHLLPVPPFKDSIQYKVKDKSLTRISNGPVDVPEKSAINSSVEVISKGVSIPPAWELIITTLNRRKRNLKDRLVQW